MDAELPELLTSLQSSPRQPNNTLKKIDWEILRLAKP
jgi:hypothetical protein